jgi:glycerate 2-kinase
VKILIAPDKFKGTLNASCVCEAIVAALKINYPEASCVKLPLADGGEGTFEILLQHLKGTIRKVTVRDPLMRPIESEYGISGDGRIAFIELARASGLHLLKESERNPLLTSTFGTGQLIAHALQQEVSQIIIGIGGSATNDAGMGMAAALGFAFRDDAGHELPPIGKSLSEMVTIDHSRVNKNVSRARFTVLCDVANPLYGPQGAACVYGPQKGADAEMVKQLDKGLTHFSELAWSQFQMDINFPGAGAAGGFGGGSRFFLNAQLRRGIEYISELTGLEEKIKAVDQVITGEGKVDEQTLSGKVVSHVVKLANKHHKPCTIVAGQCRLNQAEIKKLGARQMIILASDDNEVKAAMSEPARRIIDKVKGEFVF